MPHKRSHAAQSADRRPSRHAGTDPHAPAVQPAILAAHQLPIPAGLSYPSPAPTPKAKPGMSHAFPSHRRRHARPSRPARYPRRSPTPPFPHSSPLQPLLPLLRQNPVCPTLSRHAGADTHKPATQPAIFPVTSSPIPAHLSSSSDLYKNPGSRPPPGFFVISGSVRSPSQRRLR